MKSIKVLRKIVCGILTMLLALSFGCDKNTAGEEKITETERAVDTENMNTFKQISQEEAKKIMENNPGAVILDVREQSEFDEGHLPGAVLMPYTETEKLAPELLKDKNALILVYCRSGRRSKIAARKLYDMGYTEVYEFGGIIDWKYGTTK